MADKLELAQMIKALRSELANAQSEGEGAAIRFTVEDVELEMDIAVEQQGEGTLAAKFYVLTSQFKASKKNAVTQHIKLKLKPVHETIDPKTGEKSERPVNVRGTLDPN